MSASKTNGSTTPAWLIAIRPSRSTRTVKGISLKWHGSTRGRRQASPRRLRHELRTLSTSNLYRTIQTATEADDNFCCDRP